MYFCFFSSNVLCKFLKLSFIFINVCKKDERKVKRNILNKIRDQKIMMHVVLHEKLRGKQILIYLWCYACNKWL
jgi:hypothetical protein